MKVEYHLTYSKVYHFGHPPMTGTVIRPSLTWIMREYVKMKEWQARVPAAEIKDLKVIKREYSEEDVTPE
jgi:hypothetical protein